MKIIFIKDLKKQGKKDEIKEVKDGYAKYLIAEGYAVPYSTKSLNVLNSEINARNEKEDKLIEESKKVKSKLEKLTLKFNVKVGEKGKVFGSISSKQIAEELSKLGFEVDKKKINIETELNILGMHVVDVNLHKNVVAKINIELVK